MAWMNLEEIKLSHNTGGGCGVCASRQCNNVGVGGKYELDELALKKERQKERMNEWKKEWEKER